MTNMDDALDRAPPPDRRPRLPAWISLTLRLAATAGLMALALRGVEWPKLLDLFNTIDWRWWAAGFATAMVVQVIAAVRWALLARPIGFPFSIGLFVWRFFEGAFFSLCLPTSIGGDVVKAWCAARWTQDKRAEAALTVVVDRLVGTLALLLFSVAMIPMAWEAAPGVPLFPGYRRYQLVALLVGGMAAVALGAVVVGFYTDLLAEGALAGRLLRRLPRGDSMARALAACRLFGRHPWYVMSAAFWSLVINLAIVGTFLALADGLRLEVPARVLWFVVPAVVCVAALPITPSGLGVREHLFVSLLAIAAFPGVKHGEALALALLGYSANLVWSAVGGIVYLAFPGRTSPGAVGG